LLLSEERAEDALQQALLQAWLALSAGTEVSDVKPWLYRIVHNSALNVLRLSGYDYSQLNESLSGADAPQADLDRRIAVREALAGLAALPEMQREALLRTAVEGRTHQQVARELGLSENALRGLVYRARSALRTSLGALVPPPVVSWALGTGGRGAPVMERLSELAAGGGSAGVAGLLMKGGAVAMTASVLAGGIATMHIHPKLAHRHSTAHRTRDISQHPGATSLALAGAHAPGDLANASTPSPFPSPFEATVSRHRRVKPSAGTAPFRAIAPANALLPPSLRTDGARRGDNGGEHHGAQVSGANSPASSATSQGGKDGRGGGETESNTDGAGGTTGHDGKGGSSGESTSSGSSGDSQSQSAKPTNGGSDESANTGQSGESHDAQPSPQTAPPAGTDSSSITEQGPSSEGSKKD
jgi:RNA polymerase sigma-70 factor (ECF subfamily)